MLTTRKNSNFNTFKAQNVGEPVVHNLFNIIFIIHNTRMYL